MRVGTSNVDARKVCRASRGDGGGGAFVTVFGCLWRSTRLEQDVGRIWGSSEDGWERNGVYSSVRGRESDGKSF